jgi:hypothetical protein
MRHLRSVFAASLVACAFVAASTARADWFVDGTPVAVLGAGQGNPCAIADGTGGLFVTWDDRRAGNADIYLQHLTRAGVPSPGWPVNGVAVCTWVGDQTAARLCRDGSDGVFVAFVEQSNGIANSNIHIQRVTGAGTIAPGWPASSTFGLPVCLAVNRQNTIRMVEDGTGGALLAWLDQRQANGQNDLAFSHVLGNATIDPAWPDDGLDPFPEVYGQDTHTVFGDGAGGMFVGFADARGFQFVPLNGWDISLTHLTGGASGVPPFPAGGLAVTEILDSQFSPTMAPDGAGGFLFAFRSGLPGSLDMYAQRVDANDDVHAGWPARNAGLPLSTVTGDQDQPLAVTDVGSGMIVVWKDLRTSPTYRLYATRVTGAGAIAPGWPSAASGGLAVCNVDADQQQHAVLADGSGGAYVVWRDSRNATADLYATRLTGDGAIAPGWPASGLAVSTAAGGQQTPQLVSDGGAGAYVVWPDFRADAGDVYAAHLTPSGLASPTAGVWQAMAARFSLRLVSPNPSAGAARFALTRPGEATVRAEVIDASGRCVRALPAGRLAAGTSSLEWDGLTDEGHPAAAGLYFVTVISGAERRSVRMVVAR